MYINDYIYIYLYTYICLYIYIYMRPGILTRWGGWQGLGDGSSGLRFHEFLTLVEGTERFSPRAPKASHPERTPMPPTPNEPRSHEPRTPKFRLEPRTPKRHPSLEHRTKQFRGPGCCLGVRFLTLVEGTERSDFRASNPGQSSVKGYLAHKKHPPP